MVTLLQKGILMANAATLELETASPEVKRYQRQKITVILVNSTLSLGWMALLGFVIGPGLTAQYPPFPEERLLRLLASAALLGVTLEILTFPLDFYSGFVLEHRYQLSNQTLARWLWKRVKGYLTPFFSIVVIWHPSLFIIAFKRNDSVVNRLGL